MQVTKLFSVTLLSLAAGAALAGPSIDTQGPLSRATVQASVREAIRTGDLVPAGEGANYPRSVPVVASNLTRATVHQQTVEARDDGNLIPAGERDEEFFTSVEYGAKSIASRAEIKNATLVARNAGDLVPVGEVDDSAFSRDRAQAQYARAALAARRSAAAIAMASR